MSIQNEMISANIRNWLADIATGAKAMKIHMQYKPCILGDEWRVSSHCYAADDVTESGIAVYNLRELCEAANLDVTFVTVKKLNKNKKCIYSDNVAGAYVCEFNGVRFFDLVLKEDKRHERK